MTPGAASGGAMQLSLRPGLRLRPGETVLLTVIKQLAPDKWAVGIAGRVYPAFSRLALPAGAQLRARVVTSAGQLLLSLSAEAPDPLVAALQREGIRGPDSQVIARALILAGLPVRAETVEKIRISLGRLRLPPHRAARLAATLLDKGIDPSARGIDALLGLLSFGERGGGDPRRYRGRPLPTRGRALKEAIALSAASAADQPNALQVFNHLRGRSQTWIIVPFAFGTESNRLCGTIRIRYDPFLSRPLALVLSMDGISFHLPLEGRVRRLSIFCDEPSLAAAARRGLDSVRAKFHNMGMEVDDTIHGGDAFDGFSPLAEGTSLPIIDVAG